MERTRLEKLKELEQNLYEIMQDADMRNLSLLAKQYRDTLREIDEIEGGEDVNDTIAEIVLRHRQDR